MPHSWLPGRFSIRLLLSSATVRQPGIRYVSSPKWLGSWGTAGRRRGTGGATQMKNPFYFLRGNTKKKRKGVQSVGCSLRYSVVTENPLRRDDGSESQKLTDISQPSILFSHKTPFGTALLTVKWQKTMGFQTSESHKEECSALVFIWASSLSEYVNKLLTSPRKNETPIVVNNSWATAWCKKWHANTKIPC